MTSIGWPPLAATRKIEPRPPPGRSAKRIVSPTHDAIAPFAATSQIGSGRPPAATFVFHSLPRALNPSHFPSDDQNGDEASSEPSTGRISIESRRRTYSDHVPARNATTATERPSGEIANGSVSGL